MYSTPTFVCWYIHVQSVVNSRGGSNITGILQNKTAATPFLCSAQSPPWHYDKRPGPGCSKAD